MKFFGVFCLNGVFFDYVLVMGISGIFIIDFSFYGYNGFSIIEFVIIFNGDFGFFVNIMNSCRIWFVSFFIFFFYFR